MVPRIALEEFLKGAARLVRIVEIVVVDLPYGEQRVKAILARGVFAPEKLILLDGGTQEFLIFELPSHLDQEFGHRDRAGISFRGGWSAVINATVGVQHTLKVVSCASSGRLALERFPHALGGGKPLSRPGLRVA